MQSTEENKDNVVIGGSNINNDNHHHHHCYHHDHDDEDMLLLSMGDDDMAAMIPWEIDVNNMMDMLLDDAEERQEKEKYNKNQDCGRKKDNDGDRCGVEQQEKNDDDMSTTKMMTIGVGDDDKQGAQRRGDGQQRVETRHEYYDQQYDCYFTTTYSYCDEEDVVGIRDHTSPTKLRHRASLDPTETWMTEDDDDEEDEQHGGVQQVNIDDDIHDMVIDVMEDLVVVGGADETDAVSFLCGDVGSSSLLFEQDSSVMEEDENDDGGGNRGGVTAEAEEAVVDKRGGQVICTQNDNNRRGDEEPRHKQQRERKEEALQQQLISKIHDSTADRASRQQEGKGDHDLKPSPTHGTMIEHDDPQQEVKESERQQQQKLTSNDKEVLNTMKAQQQHQRPQQQQDYAFLHELLEERRLQLAASMERSKASRRCLLVTTDIVAPRLVENHIQTRVNLTKVLREIEKSTSQVSEHLLQQQQQGEHHGASSTTISSKETTTKSSTVRTVTPDGK